MGLTPNHKPAGMALDGDSCLVHDVCAHGIQNGHLPTSQKNLHISAAVYTHTQTATRLYIAARSCRPIGICAIAASGVARTQMKVTQLAIDDEVNAARKQTMIGPIVLD